MKEVPIWEKANLTLEEAAVYSGIDTGKLREITNEEGCNFVLWVGTKRLIKKRLFDLTGRAPVCTIADAEPLGPSTPMDALVIAPCTGNTMAKLAHGVTDTAVTMAAKAHLRNGKPLVIAFSTNDGLTGSAPNIAALFNRKNVYLVPYKQDDFTKKPYSLASDFALLPDAIEAALEGRQLQPIIL